MEGTEKKGVRTVKPIRGGRFVGFVRKNAHWDDELADTLFSKLEKGFYGKKV